MTDTMTQQEGNNDGAASPNQARRPYSKPAFRSESVFETMALACGKLRGQAQDQCRRSAANS